MLRTRIGVLCLAAVACKFASFAQETAAAAAGTFDNELLATVATEPQSKTPPDLLLGDTTLPAQPQAEADVLQESDNQADASAVKAEEFAAKVLALTDAFPPRAPNGTRTTLLGLAGIMLFLALHLIAQYVRYAALDKDVLFDHDSGRLTFTGAGLIVSLVLFAAGLAEAVPEFMKNRNAASNFPSLARGAKRTLIGKRLFLMSALALALGWVIGAPQFVMEVAATGFLAGSTLSALGLALLISYLKRRDDVEKKLHAFDIKDASAMGEDAVVDSALLIQLIDHLWGNQKGLEALLAEKGLPFAEDKLSAAAQPESGERGKQFDIGAKQTGAVLNADTFAQVVQQLQELQQQQQKGATRDTSHGSLLNALVQAAKEFQKHPEILLQASQLLQQLEMMPAGGAPARDMANLLESASAATEEAKDDARSEQMYPHEMS